MEESDVDRIKSQLSQYCEIDDRGCWLWTRGRAGAGYGQMTLSGRRGVYAHRASFLAYRGQIPSGMFVCHVCDVPLCCNPQHLFLGTPKDNSQDSIRKGRWRPGRVGGPNKLNAKDIADIVELRKRGMLQREIGAMFGVSQVRVSQLTRNQ